VTRRHFGYVRQRPSGRWQATFRHEGTLHSIGTFTRKADALRALAECEVRLAQRSWTTSGQSDLTFGDYATSWLEHRPGLAERTIETYRYLLQHHLMPQFQSTRLRAISPSDVRAWNAAAVAKHPSTAAKSYRLMSTILRTAVTDGIITTSPCRVKGAAQEHAATRPTASVVEVAQLTEAMDPRLRIAVDLAVWCQLRKAEVLGLTRGNVDLEGGAIDIIQTRTYLTSGKPVIKPPKTAAGRRRLTVPPPVLERLAAHLTAYVAAGPDALILCGRDGTALSQAALQRAFMKARRSIGRDDLHFHDLRHTGLTLAAITGATTAELMHRAGHRSPDAAIRYQHATLERDRSLARLLGELSSQLDVTPE
jgi:integrase